MGSLELGNGRWRQAVKKLAFSSLFGAPKWHHIYMMKRGVVEALLGESGQHSGGNTCN
jgi:hypothetical protein